MISCLEMQLYLSLGLEVLSRPVLFFFAAMFPPVGRGFIRTAMVSGPPSAACSAGFVYLLILSFLSLSSVSPLPVQAGSLFVADGNGGPRGRGHAGCR